MDDAGLPAGILLFLVFALIGLAVIRAFSNPVDRDFQLKLFFVAFGARFLASVIIYQFGLVAVIKDEDASGWYVGKDWNERWQESGLSYLDLPGKVLEAYNQQHKGYYYLVAALFYITELPYRLSAAALNCFIGAWTVVIGYRTARALFGERIAVRVGWWTCFYPSLIVWSAQTLKEPVVILLECLVIYSCVSMRQHGKLVANLLVMTFAIVLLIPFRFYAAYIAGAALILNLIFGSLSAKGQSAPRIVYFVVTTACFLILAFFLLSRERETELLTVYNLERLEKYRDDMASGAGGPGGSGSNVKIEADLRSPFGLTVSLVVGAAYLLFAPFPWQMLSGSTRMLLVAPEVMLWWWLLFTGVFPGLMVTIRTRFRDVLPLLVMIFGLGLLYSLTFANIGLVYRQRAQLLPWLIIFAVVGREHRNASNRNGRRNDRVDFS